MTGETSFKRPTLRRSYRIWLRSLFRGWTFAAWLAAAVLAIYLASTNTQFGEIAGVVETAAEPVAPLETARLVAVNVRIGQFVKAGDTVAAMDTSMVDAEVSLADAEMAEERDTISGYQRDILQMAQRSESAVSDAETALETATIQQARDTAELAELRKEQRRREDLLAKRLVGEELASELRPAIAALEQGLAASPALIKVQARRSEQAQKERNDMRIWLRIDGDRDVSAAIRDKARARMAVSESNGDLARRRRENYQLRAARDGVVSLILHAPGDVVSSGDPVLRLISRSHYVVGFLPEVQLAQLTVGERVIINRSAGDTAGVGAVVESIGPEVQALPGRISPIRGQTLRGRRVLLKLDDGHNFIPGETVRICDVAPFWDRIKQQTSRLFGR